MFFYFAINSTPIIVVSGKVVVPYIRGLYHEVSDISGCMKNITQARSQSLIILTGSLSGEFRVFYFLNPFIANFGQPLFKGFRIGRRDGLNDAEDAFSVGTI